MINNQVAINFLNQVRKIILDDKSWLESTTQPINEAFDKAISELEKQIPKNPNMIQTDYNANLWHLHCPSCNNYIGMWNSRLNRGYMHNISNGNICPYCGQEIDCTGVE